MEETNKAQEPKKPRNIRRLEKVKKEFLDTLVLAFFTKRSALNDLDGVDVADLFDDYNRQWVYHCTKFNKKLHATKLRYEAFTESVDFYIKMEKTQMEKTAEANKTKDYEYWLRHVKVGEILFFVILWYKIISFWNKEKWTHLLKNYYIKHVLVKII